MNEMQDNIKEKGGLERRRRIAEALATVGLVLLAVGLIAPFASIDNATVQGMFKWIFASGALLYTGARAINVNAPGDSIRLRRLRRLELWAGIIFCVAAFFWFYKAARLGEYGFSLALIHDTILFTLAGALIQIIASWMISSRMRKEEEQRGAHARDGEN